MPDEDVIEYRFPFWCRVGAPTAVALVAGGLLGFVVWSRTLDLLSWLAILVGVLTVGMEALKRSMAVIVTMDKVVECDLIGRRTFQLAQLERARLFRNTRLWLYFRGDPKPVWVIRGMGDLRAMLDIVVSRARVHGVSPEVVRVEKS